MNQPELGGAEGILGRDGAKMQIHRRDGGSILGCGWERGTAGSATEPGSRGRWCSWGEAERGAGHHHRRAWQWVQDSGRLAGKPGGWSGLEPGCWEPGFQLSRTTNQTLTSRALTSGHAVDEDCLTSRSLASKRGRQQVDTSIWLLQLSTSVINSFTDTGARSHLHSNRTALDSKSSKAYLSARHCAEQALSSTIA